MMIRIDTEELDRAVKFLEGIPGAAQKATRTALTKTMRGAQKEAIKKVTERYTIKQEKILPCFSQILRVSDGMTVGFRARGRVNDLAYFRHKPGSVPKRRPPKGKYLYSQVVKGEGGTIAHAFLARMKSGHVGVFQREGHGASNASLPIEKMAGPSTPQMLESPSVAAFIQQKMEERLAKNMEHEVNAFLMGYRR
ncbi:MAG: phage tail protein [Selenomonadaceae bacterium]|nr:phage tail protein [Selenomonadaceae bacterium]